MTKLKKAHRTQYHRTFTPLAQAPDVAHPDQAVDAQDDLLLENHADARYRHWPVCQPLCLCTRGVNMAISTFRTLPVYTLASAGKVKHIRRNSRVRIAPCTMRGTVTGPWVEAEATIVDATTAAHGHALLRHKYGWMKGIGDVFSRLLHRERVVIAIRFPV